MKAAIDILQRTLRVGSHSLDSKERDEIIGAICRLIDWPKWEPLIEAAGKVDKLQCLDYLNRCDNTSSTILETVTSTSSKNLGTIYPKEQIRALLEALPEEEK